jgi:hypothetical protein
MSSHSRFLRQLADRTGESFSFLQNRGFSLVTSADPSAGGDDDEDRRPLMVDWDQVDEDRWAK